MNEKTGHQKGLKWKHSHCPSAVHGIGASVCIIYCNICLQSGSALGGICTHLWSKYVTKRAISFIFSIIFAFFQHKFSRRHTWYKVSQKFVLVVINTYIYHFNLISKSYSFFFWLTIRAISKEASITPKETRIWSRSVEIIYIGCSNVLNTFLAYFNVSNLLFCRLFCYLC